MFPATQGLFAVIAGTALFAGSLATPAATQPVTIKTSNPLIRYEGRWDNETSTWWAGSGFKLHVSGLSNLTLNLGSSTSWPNAPIGVSVGGGEFFGFNATAGANVIPLGVIPKSASTTVRINVQGSSSNRLFLESILLNSGAKLLPYEAKSPVTFQYIGDSFSTGYLLPEGINQGWTFLVGEKYQAEYRVTAQPGAALTNISSYGNVNGMSYQFFRTEDTGFYYDPSHNYTTPWNFARDQPPPTHVFIHIGANDNAQGVTDATFVQVYNDFLDKVRVLYPKQPFFLLTPWGWPLADGSVAYYYQGLYQQVLGDRQAKGDKNIFLIDATGWLTYADVMPDNLHPNVGGQEKIANNIVAFLENWGLAPPL